MSAELVPCEWRDGLTGVQCRLQEGHTGTHVGRVDDVIAATESAHDRAFRAMRAALQTVQDDCRSMNRHGVTWTFQEQVDRALALAQAADSPTTEAEA